MFFLHLFPLYSCFYSYVIFTPVSSLFSCSLYHVLPTIPSFFVSLSSYFEMKLFRFSGSSSFTLLFLHTIHSKGTSNFLKEHGKRGKGRKNKEKILPDMDSQGIEVQVETQRKREREGERERGKEI